MPNRFTHSVRPRQRPGVFGALLGVGEGVATGLRDREARKRRLFEQSIQDALIGYDPNDDGTTVAEPTDTEPTARAAHLPAQPATSEGYPGSHMMDELSQALQPAQSPVQLPRDAGGFPVVGEGPGTPVFNPDPEQQIGGGGFSPRDAEIMAATQGRRPGDIRLSLQIPPERLSLGEGKGSFENPRYREAVQRRDLFEALVGAGRTEEEALIAVLEGVPGSPEGVYGQAPNAQRKQDLLELRGFDAGRGDPVSRRQSTQNRAETLAADAVRNGVDIVDAIGMATTATGFTPDMDAVQDIVDQFGRNERDLLAQFGPPNTNAGELSQVAYQRMLREGPSANVAIMQEADDILREARAIVQGNPTEENQRLLAELEGEVNELRVWLNPDPQSPRNRLGVGATALPDRR